MIVPIQAKNWTLSDCARRAVDAAGTAAGSAQPRRRLTLGSVVSWPLHNIDAVDVESNVRNRPSSESDVRDRPTFSHPFR
jgi:hypothetical protein